MLNLCGLSESSSSAAGLFLACLSYGNSGSYLGCFQNYGPLLVVIILRHLICRGTKTGPNFGKYPFRDHYGDPFLHAY